MLCKGLGKLNTGVPVLVVNHEDNGVLGEVTVSLSGNCKLTSVLLTLITCYGNTVSLESVVHAKPLVGEVLAIVAVVVIKSEEDCVLCSFKGFNIGVDSCVAFICNNSTENEVLLNVAGNKCVCGKYEKKDYS